MPKSHALIRLPEPRLLSAPPQSSQNHAPPFRGLAPCPASVSHSPFQLSSEPPPSWFGSSSLPRLLWATPLLTLWTTPWPRPRPPGPIPIWSRGDRRRRLRGSGTGGRGRGAVACTEGNSGRRAVAAGAQGPWKQWRCARGPRCCCARCRCWRSQGPPRTGRTLRVSLQAERKRAAAACLFMSGVRVESSTRLR